MSCFWRVVGCLGLFFSSAAVLIGAEPVDEQTVSKVVARLNAPTRAEREAAERELLELGPAVLEMLPEMASDPAIDAALTRIRQRLNQQRATSRASEATRASIIGSGPLGEVAADWLDETGFPRIDISPEWRRRPVVLDLQNIPYWQAIDRLAEEAELWPDEWSRAGGLAFRERTAEDAAVRLDYPGAFRVAGGPVTVKALPGEPRRALYRLPLEIRAEPEVRPLFLIHAANSGALYADDGTRLEAFTPGATYELPMGEAGGIARLRLDFAGPITDGPLTFEGEFVATVASRAVPFLFELSRNGFQPVEKSEGGVTVRLRDAEWKKNGSVQVSMAVVYADGISAFESYRTWVYHNDAVLIVERGDEDVLKIEHEPVFETVAQSPGALLLRYTFQDVPEEAEGIRFEYRAPTEVIEVPLEVKLEGLVVR